MPSELERKRRDARERAGRALPVGPDVADGDVPVDAENPPLDESFWQRAKPLQRSRLERMPKARAVDAPKRPQSRKANDPVPGE